jgi:hypothetical protein
MHRHRQPVWERHPFGTTCPCAACQEWASGSAPVVRLGNNPAPLRLSREANLSEEIQHLFEVYGEAAVRAELGSQQGGPTETSTRPGLRARTAKGSDGLPSCDSPEVATARAAFAPFATTNAMDLRVAGRGLLRMVDELRADIAKRDEWNTRIILERDELRAKLATAEREVTRLRRRIWPNGEGD